MIDLSRVEFRFLTLATPAMYEYVRSLCESIEDAIEIADRCPRECDGCPSCDQAVGELWELRAVALFGALQSDDSVLRLVNVPPGASVWDVVDTLPLPLHLLDGG